MKKIVSALLAAALMTSLFCTAAVAEDSGEASKKDTAASQDSGLNTGINRAGYEDYLNEHQAAPKGTKEIVVDASKLTAKTAGVELRDNYKGTSGTSIYTTEGDTVSFAFDADEGIYGLELEYYTEPGKNISIERSLYINEKLPFSAAEFFTFTRTWIDKPYSDDQYFQEDIYGNHIRPTQEEQFRWRTSSFYDYLGYETTPLQFYFKQGRNTIKLVSSKEPMTIKSIRLVPVKEIRSYAEVKAEYEQKGYQNYSGEELFVQGENPTWKSDQTLYPNADLSTPDTTPYKDYKMLINYIGGSRWQYQQQSITWTISVPEDGLYKLNAKYRKNSYQGMLSCRKIYINGEIPFKEAEEVSFAYTTNWKNETVKTADGEDCLFYLKKGDNDITLETTLGKTGEMLSKAENALFELNSIYRQIIIVTGTDPDKFRDYKFKEIMPEVVESLKTQADILNEVVAGIIEISGSRGSEMSTLESTARQMLAMHKEPEKIATELSQFKTNIGSLGTWLSSAKNIPLDIDYLSVLPAGKEEKAPGKNFFENIMFSINQFIGSFTIDYNSIGNMNKESDPNKTIRAWISTGRDQFQTLRTMINDQFTKNTGYAVNLELTNMAALLPTVVAGIGPDVALGLGQAEPVNYALRHAAKELSQFEGFDEVTKRFSKEAMVPYQFNGGYYALPETQTFNIMLYRKDVLAELGIAVPTNWNEVIDVITELNKNNLEFGIPVPGTLDFFYAMLLQNGADMYKENGMASAWDTDEANRAFKTLTDFYVNYDVSMSYDFQNRFRTGEMPIGIAPFTLYNTIQVAAPEIRGLWDFALIPGTLNENGTVNNSSALTTTCSFIIAGTKNPEVSWEFLKWWTSADAQSKFGTELECILGPSGRYNTANTEAFEKLPWSAKEIKMLNKQLDVSYGLPEVPGGYFVQRHVNNAVRKVIYSATSIQTKDVLLDYSEIVNQEITNKRKEFGLPVISK